MELRDAETRAVVLAEAAADLGGDCLFCPECCAVWRRDAALDARRFQPACLLCGGPLTPLP
jgi:hypothetical protein